MGRINTSQLYHRYIDSYQPVNLQSHSHSTFAYSNAKVILSIFLPRWSSKI